MPLTAPTLTVASHTSASITLNIATPASGGTPPYTLTLHRSTHSDYSGDDVTRVVTAGDFPLTVTGLTPETTYYFKVPVSDSAAGSANGATASGTTDAAPEAANRNIVTQVIAIDAGDTEITEQDTSISSV
jgi:chitodextrinase